METTNFPCKHLKIQGYELLRTVTSVFEQYDDYINSHDVVLSIIKQQLIEERIEREHMLGEWEKKPIVSFIRIHHDSSGTSLTEFMNKG